MKKLIPLFFASAIFVTACNNEAKDSVEKADSANEEKLDNSNNNQTVVDEESSSFLVKAADAGMAEVELGQLGQQKAINAQVKAFGAMMVHDHSMANDQVKALAAKRSVTLPSMPGDDNKKDKDDLANKSGADFDRAFMNQMVDDHQDAINLFENSAGKVNDTEVKTFINNTIPKLKMHLDSAKAIQKRIK
jgi:putative membrane protein